ncbi:MAG: holo-ACP synthase [Planctomycetota bacterium]
MHVFGIGTDIIECSRIANMLEKHDAIFIERVYTAGEIEYCSPRKSRVQHFAGRWAAKEAVLKAMGTGWAKGIKWNDIEIKTMPGGKPEVQLNGVAGEICRKRGITDMLVSISHTKEFATAFATAVGEPPPQDET